MQNPIIRKFRLHSMPEAQAHIIIKYDNDFDHVSITLISYFTEVLKICTSRSSTSVSAELFASGIYSVTISRHINRFTEEFCGTNQYHTIKSALKAAENSAFWVSVGPIDYDTAIAQALKYLNNSFAFGSVKKYTGRY